MRKLINVIITSSIMIVVIILLRKLFESRVKSGAICVLWALVAIRLLIPVQLFGNVVNVTDYLTAVSYTHLTLPTKRIVEISVVAV